MDSSTKKDWLVPVLVYTVIGAALSVIYFTTQGLFSKEGWMDVILCLANGFGITGIFLVCVRMLSWVKREGAFDAVSYAGTFCLHALLPFMGNRIDENGNKVKKPMDYYSFKQRRRDKEEARPTSAGYALFVGLGYIAISAIFTVIFMANYTG